MTAAADRALRRIVRGGAANLGGATVSAVSGFGLVIVVTRGYDLSDAGALFASVSVFLILLATVELGADQGFVRFIAWLRARGEHPGIPVVLRTGFTAVIAAATIVAVAGAASASALAGLIAAGEDPERVGTMLRVLCAALPVAAAYELALAATRGYGTMRPTVLVERLARPALQVALVLLAATGGAGIGGLALAWSAPYAVGLVAAVLALRRVRAAAPPPTGPGLDVAGSFWRFTAARGLARVCQVALQRVDVVLVAAMRGPRDAAVYMAITRFIVLGQLAVHAITQTIQPRFAELLATDDRDTAATVLRQVTTWLVAMTWPLYLSFAVHAAVVVTVFGTGYGEGAASLALISLAMLAATAAGPVDVVLTMAGRSGLSLANTATALVVNVALCVLLVPSHGVLGAAVAWAAAILVRNGLAVVQVRVHVGIVAGSRPTATVAAAAVVSFGLLPWLGSLTADPWLSVLSIALGTAGYLGLLWRHRDPVGLSVLTSLVRRSHRPAPVTDR